MIKYLGSKRRLVPALSVLAAASGARRALDLFTGTTRVAQAFKRLGMEVVAVDRARAAHVLARCYVATDPVATPEVVDEARSALDALDALTGHPGYVTETFCVRSRFFHPDNGARIDAIRDAIERDYAGTPLWPVLLTSLLEAADRVDSTTGVQMAYLKQWAPRALRPLELRLPVLVDGPGRAIRGDAVDLVGGAELGPVDLAYVDPPYNQHRYEANYHVWETLVAWDAPAHFGVACKREDLRDPANRSAFNSKRTMPDALARVVAGLEADVVVVSCSDEAWLDVATLVELCSVRGHVAVVGFDSARYVGAQIGIHGPTGRRVGQVTRLRNVEYLVIGGDRHTVRRMVEAVEAADLGGRVVPASRAPGRSACPTPTVGAGLTRPPRD